MQTETVALHFLLLLNLEKHLIAFHTFSVNRLPALWTEWTLLKVTLPFFLLTLFVISHYLYCLVYHFIGGKAYGLLKSQQEETLDSINEVSYL